MPGGSGECQSTRHTVPNEPSPTVLTVVHDLCESVRTVSQVRASSGELKQTCARVTDDEPVGFKSHGRSSSDNLAVCADRRRLLSVVICMMMMSSSWLRVTGVPMSMAMAETVVVLVVVVIMLDPVYV